MTNDELGTEKNDRRQALPAVRVHGMTIGLPEGAEPSEWFACCTDQVWLYPENRPAEHRDCSDTIEGYHAAHWAGCTWYGPSRSTRREAENDATRHRRAHASTYRITPVPQEDR